MGRAVPRPGVRARGRPARAPDRRRARDAQRLDRARAVLHAVVDVGRLRRALQPPRRGRARAARSCSSPASIPAGVAAVAIEPASTGDSRGVRAQPRGHAARARRARTASPSGARTCCGGGSPARASSRRRCSSSRSGCRSRSGTSLWAIGDRHRVRRDARRGPRGDAARAPRARPGARCAPADPEEALDAHHFAERFGLFLIILLGEVVVEAGQASVDGARRRRRRLGRAGRGDGARRRAVVAVLRLGGGDQPQGARAVGRLADDGARDLRRRPHAAGVRAADHRRRRRAAARGGPAARSPTGSPASASASTCSARACSCTARAGVPGAAARARRSSRRSSSRGSSRRCRRTQYLWLLAVWIGACAALTTRVSSDADVERLVSRGRAAAE